MAGLHCQFGETGQEGSETGDVPHFPASALDVFRAEPEDHPRARHSNGVVQRPQGPFKDIGPGTGLFVGGELGFVASVLILFLAVDPIGEGMANPIQGQGVQPGFRSFVDPVGLGHLFLQPVGDPVSYRSGQRSQKGQPPVVSQQQGQVYHHHHPGVEDFRGEFPHPFRTGVHVPHGFRHQVPQVLLLEGMGIQPHQAVVQGVAHGPAHPVGKQPHAVPLPRPGKLDQEDHPHIERRQTGHIPGHSPALGNVVETLGQLPFEIGPRSHPQVIEDTGDRHRQQHGLLLSKIGKDMVRPPYLPDSAFKHKKPPPVL